MKLNHFHSPVVALTSIAVAAILVGCSTTDSKLWQVAPNYRISNTGASAEMGYTALARKYEGERRWPEAIIAWRKAAAAAPQDAEILNALGLAEARQGRFANAIATLRRALALSPQRVQFLNNLGYALLLDGRSLEAKEILSQALVLKPDYPLARINFSRAEQAIVITQTVVTASKKPDSILDPPAPTETANIRGLTAGATVLQTEPNVGVLEIRLEGLAKTTLPAPSMALTTQPVVVAKVTPPVPPAVPVKSESTTHDHATIEIANGNGVPGMAVWLNGWMQGHGLRRASFLRNERPFATATTVVLYRPGFLKNAQELAKRMPQHIKVAPEPGGPVDADLRVVLGHDFRSATPCQRSCPTYVATTLSPTSVVAAL